MMSVTNQLSRLILSLGGIGLSGGVFFPCGAQTAPILGVPSPLPPSILNDADGPLTVPPPPQWLSQSPQKELIFQRNAPPSSDLIFRQQSAAPLESAPTPPGEALFYRVQVSGDSPRLLSQVREIEPLAHIRQTDQTIQAGTFTQSHLAQERLEQLTQKGLEARVFPVTSQEGLISHPSQLRYQIR